MVVYLSVFMPLTVVRRGSRIYVVHLFLGRASFYASRITTLLPTTVGTLWLCSSVPFWDVRMAVGCRVLGETDRPSSNYRERARVIIRQCPKRLLYSRALLVRKGWFFLIRVCLLAFANGNNNAGSQGDSLNQACARATSTRLETPHPERFFSCVDSNKSRNLDRL